MSGTKSLTVGDALDLSVAPTLSSGAGSFTYQWKKGSANVANGAGVTGATSANLKIASVATTDAGTYTCVVSESTASNSPQTSVNAVVTVAAAPVAKTIAAKPAVASIKAGGATVPATDLFTFTNCAAGDFDYTITPAHAGVSVSSAGVVTAAANASLTGTVKVVATASTATGAVTGSPATGTITAVTAPDLTGFTKDKTAGTVKSDGSDTVVVTLASVPTNAILGAVTATVASGKKLKAVVGTGNDANKVTISADSGAAASTDDGDVTIAVAGVTATQTVAITVVAP